MSGANRLEELLVGLFTVIVVVFVLWLILTLVEYILSGIALSRMAKNAGFPTPVLAWVPIASSYLLGSLCDRAQYHHTGREWKFSVLLPAAEVLSLFGGRALFGFLADFIIHSSGTSAFYSIPSLLGNLFTLAVAVLTGFALYQLYRDYAPGREVLYTVLSVLLGGLGRAVILMTLRDRIPLSAGAGGWGPPPGYPPQGPPAGYPGYPPQGPPQGYGPQAGPWQSGSGTTGWSQPPGPGGAGTTGWDPPPSQSQGGASNQWPKPPGAEQ